MATYNTRPIANLPQNATSSRTSQHPPPLQQNRSHPHGHPQSTAPPPRMPIQSIYNPSQGELHGGPRNRLFLALRSGIESEVDWALPRLVLGSFDHGEIFKLDGWPDSVNALLAYPLRWLEELEKESALYCLRHGIMDAEGKEGLLGIVSDWSRDVELENRAVNSLLVLRNASLSSANAKSICKAPFIDLVARVFSLPVQFLTETSLRNTEPLQHLFVLVQSTFPYIQHSTLTSTSSTTANQLMQAFSNTLPTMIVETRDAGILNYLLPILIVAFQIPNIPLPPTTLIPHLFKSLTLSPPTPLLEYSIDLLISLTQNSANSRTILADRDFPAHLRNMVILLEHGVRKMKASWDASDRIYGVTTVNPASAVGMLEQAIKKRKADREQAQKIIQSGDAAGVVVEVGDRPPHMSVNAKRKLLAMPEPERAIHWMHENFVYCSTSSVLQVTFWHAYRDFFTNAAPHEHMLSASEVIKNVTVAFPGSSPKVIQDPTGNKFVIWGLGWRKGSEDHRFTCHWSGCTKTNGHNEALRLLDHVRSTHLPDAPTCSWGSCRHTPLTLSHVCTHLPMTHPVPVCDHITVHPSTQLSDNPLHNIISRPVAPLSKHHKLGFTGFITATDARQHPIGVTYLTSLLLRNIARTLRSDLTSALPADAGLTQEAKAERKRHLQEERFGLPIPDNVLREEEEEEKEAGSSRGQNVVGIDAKELERARLAFETAEPRILEVIEGNMSGLSQYLGECAGFGAFGGW